MTPLITATEEKNRTDMSRSIKTGIAAASIAGLALTGCSASASDVPAFDDIEEAMWESMAASDAMAMTAVLPEAMASDAAIIEDMLGGDLTDLQIYGSLNESATAIRLGEDEDPIMSFFGDEVYVSMDMLFEAMGSTLPEVSQAEVEEMMGAFEGKYLDMSEEYPGDAETVDVSELLDQMRTAAESDQTDEVTGFNFHELQQEGSYMQLDMETEDTGWFYSIDGEGDQAIMNGEATQFLGVVSDHEAPRLERITKDGTRMEFTWDEEVDIPERPTEDQLVTEEDLMEVAMGQ